MTAASSAPEDHFDAWWREALCAEIGSDLFFVAKGQSVADAKAVCRLCPVRAKCLADSLRSDVEYGVFGGFARPVRKALMVPVRKGVDPMDVAVAAIEREEKARPRVTWTRR